MYQLEADLIGILAKYKNVYTQYEDRINQSLFTHVEYCEILADIPHNDYYSLLRKYGELLPDCEYTPDYAMNEADKLINRLHLSATQSKLNEMCTSFTKEYMANNNPSIDGFLEQIKKLDSNVDDIPVYDTEHFLDTIQNNLDVEIPTLQTKIGNFRKKSFVVLAGRPGMGKTTMAANIFVDCLKRKIRSVFFSLEMPADQIHELSKCIVADKSPEDKGFTQGQMTELTNFIIAAKNNMFVIDKERMTLKAIERTINRITVKHGKPELVIIDNLNLIGKTKEDEYNALSEITAELKTLSKRLDIVLIVIAHLNRENSNRANKKPILSDLRGSGTIEQDADYVVFVHREEYYYEEKNETPPVGVKNIMEWWQPKNRHDKKLNGYYRTNLHHKRINEELKELEIVDYLNAKEKKLQIKGVVYDKNKF